jgi:hypothetical protein
MAGTVLALQRAKQATNDCLRRQTIKQESTSPHDLSVKHLDSFPRAQHQRFARRCFGCAVYASYPRGHSAKNDNVNHLPMANQARKVTAYFRGTNIFKQHLRCDCNHSLF